MKARGNVENWLGLVEDAMMVSLRKLTKAAIGDFDTKPRHEWATQHPSQVVISVSQIMWCRDLTECLTGEDGSVVEAVKGAEERCFQVSPWRQKSILTLPYLPPSIPPSLLPPTPHPQNLNKLAELVRGKLPKLIRNIIGALITIDVHARDTVTQMVMNGASGPQDFEWVKNIRYYWDQEIDNCVVRMSNSYYIYGYEYLGASARLVITPLTVRSTASIYILYSLVPRLYPRKRV